MVISTGGHVEEGEIPVDFPEEGHQIPDKMT